MSKVNFINVGKFELENAVAVALKSKSPVKISSFFVEDSLFDNVKNIVCFTDSGRQVRGIAKLADNNQWQLIAGMAEVKSQGK